MKYFKGVLLFCLVGLSISCSEKKSGIQDYELAAQWADMDIYITRFTPQNSPTYASRCLGYLGLMQYESIVHGYPEYQSLAGQLTDLNSLPLPDSSSEYNWRIVMNHANSYFLKKIYLQTSDENKLKIDSLENSLEEKILNEYPSVEKTVEISKKYAEILSDAIYEYSKTDGGHRGYLNNFDPNFKPKVFPGSWQPALFAQAIDHRPLHPHWGQNRTFSKESMEMPLPEMIPYSTDKNSEYYKQFLQVYEIEKNLTQEDKETAIWWSDDPSETFSPAGHSFYLTNYLVRKEKPNLIQSAQIYATVGMSVADAFVKCWLWKYHFFTERANTYIPAHIDKEWNSFWPDPPFPAFPSGHAIQASACANSLMAFFNNETPITDSSHVGRPKDMVRNTEFKVRHFDTIWEIATETAYSRQLGGIHIEHDNKVGLEQGKNVSNHIIQLKWKK